MHRISFVFLFPLFLLQSPIFGFEMPLASIKTAAKAFYDPRDYYATMTPTERESIRFIILTLGNEPLYKLYNYEGEMTKAADRFKSVHPLNVWAEFLTSPDSVSALVNARNRKLVWPTFMKGMAASFQEAHDGNNLKEEYIADFAKKVGMNKDKDKSAIKELLKKQDWPGFVQYLIDHTKKTSTNDRYNL